MKRLNLLLLSTLWLAIDGMEAHAQDKYPVKPVTLYVPYAAGGPADVLAHVLAEELKILLDQPVVVENKPRPFDRLAMELAMMRPNPTAAR